MTLARLSLQGITAGSTTLHLELIDLDADGGDDLVPTAQAVDGVLQVSAATGGGCPPEALPGASGPPQDLNGDGLCEDVNGNSRKDFDDAVRLALSIEDIEGRGWVPYFDVNHNRRIDFDDAVQLALSIGGASAAQQLLQY